MEAHLKIEHLAPYLPYRLKMRCIEDKTNHILTIAHQTYDLSTVGLYPILKGDFYKKFKPILRPLSDLTKDNVAEFYQLDSIDLELIDIDEWTEELIHMINAGDKFQLRQFNLLFSWHFDIFNLIPQGLAISINDINK